MRRGILLTILMVLLAVCLTLAGCGSSGDTTSATETSDSGTVTKDVPPPVDSGVVRVVLSWNEPVDMDLEIWDAEGQNAVTSAGLESADVKDGTAGSEFFDFTGDYVEGEYVVSVYFAEQTNVVDEANVTLTVTKADGSTDTRVRTIKWEKGSDQWHAFKVDAATGDLVDIDEIVQTEVTE